MGEATADMATVDIVARDLLMLPQKLMPTTDPLDTDTAPDTDLDTDMAVMVLALPAMEVMVLDMDMVDTVSTRDPLMPTMEATDMVVMDVDTEVMVDTDTVDTVARDLLMPTTDPLDTDTAPDTDMAAMVLALPAMEVMVLDMDTDTKFCFLYNKLPLILISIPYTKRNQKNLSACQPKLRKSFEIDQNYQQL